MPVHFGGRRWWGAALAALVFILAPGPWTALRAQDDGVNPRLALPRSHLGHDLDSPVFLVGQVGVGGAFSHANDQFGYGGAIIFHPGAAASFSNSLAGWNVAMVLQIDYQEMYTSYRIRSGDLLFRKYLQPADRKGTRVLPFVGAGVGLSSVSFPVEDDRASETYWAPVAELGCEIVLADRYLVLLRGQYKHYTYHELDYINWSARFGLGTLLPW
ncbi:hypothetical protein KJ682_03385 [bacterium]|nr:hypothetical protein [bacterium]